MYFEAIFEETVLRERQEPTYQMCYGYCCRFCGAPDVAIEWLLIVQH